MALIQLLAFSIKLTIFESISYIFKFFSLLTSYILMVIFPGTEKSQIALCSKVEENHQCVTHSDIKSRHSCESIPIEHKEMFKDKDKNTSLNNKPENAHKIVLKDYIHNQDLLKSSIVHQRQLRCTGDSCELSVMHHLELRAKPRQRICYTSKSNQEIKQNKKSKINPLSKFTMSSLMDVLNTKTEIILSLVDELNKNTKMVTNQVCGDISMLTPECNSLCKSPNGSEKIKFSEIKTYGRTTEEEIKPTDDDLCCCSDTHRCLLNVDSEDDFDDRTVVELLMPGKLTDEITSPIDVLEDPVRKGILTPDELVGGDLIRDKHLTPYQLTDGEPTREELLTPEELASVETGFDDDWLYKAIKSEPISVSP